MKYNKEKINYPLIVITIAVTAVFFLIGMNRLKFETDILKSLPQGDPVISDAVYMFKYQPMQDRVVIDLSLQKKDIHLLVEGGVYVEKMLRESNLIKGVSMDNMQKIFPDLMSYIINNLPALFTEKELNTRVKPLLERSRVAEAMKNNLSRLLNLQGIGQSDYIARDPLGLKNIVLEKLGALVPSKDVQIYNGRPVSSDGKHLLIVAEPVSSGTDTASSRKLVSLLNKIEISTENKFKAGKNRFVLTPVGAYRSALDNEEIARLDTKRAIAFATIGIALLLLIAFPRPWLGLLSLVPAVFGTMMSIFVFSLFNDSISLLALGFGGAIISISVDLGITYLLFLDRPYKTYGRHAAKEVWSVGLIATLTTVGAFAFLTLSGFESLVQIGQFAATGILFSFIFVHTIFPLFFPSLRPAKKEKVLPLQTFVNRLGLSGKWYTAFGALVFASVMLFFARPDYHVNISSMNTVSSKTLAAEELVKKTWGDIFSKTYLMVEGNDIAELQKKGDHLLSMLDDDIDRGSISSVFLPSVIFPGPKLLQKNLADWKKFWGRGRKARLKKQLLLESEKLGFAPDAFDPFFATISRDNMKTRVVPEKFWQLLNIAWNKDRKKYMFFSTIVPGKLYNGDSFFSKYSSSGLMKLFDAKIFSKRLGELIAANFIHMLIIIGISILLLLLIFFFDWKLTLISILPILFAFISTLGTMKIIGHPFDIPSLMLSIIILGMGIDYSLYLVRSYQRYRDELSPSLGLIRLGVFMASASTIIGFGVLAFAKHSVLKSAGVTSVLGIGYSLIGAYAILPPILKWFFAPEENTAHDFEPGSREHTKYALMRYKRFEPYPRLFARFKIMLDPMFPRLIDFIKKPKVIIDLGCGYAVPSVWLLEAFPEARVYALDPDSERIRVASHVIGDRGTAEVGSAPAIPAPPSPADYAMLLDMVHYLSDVELDETLDNLYAKMAPGGSLIIRVTIPSGKKYPWERYMEMLRVRLLHIEAYFRSSDELSQAITDAGFTINLIEATAQNREETWIIAEKKTKRKP